MSDMVPEVLNAALDSLFTPKEPGEQEYQGVDGLLYCRNCHTPVQCRVKLWSRDKIVPCLCRCQQEAMAEKKRQDELVERQRKIRQLKATGIQEKHGKYISAYACDAKTCDEEFLLSKRQYEHITGRTQAHDVIAYQIRQSFKPGEITPEEANKVGYETAMRFTKGKHAFIVATHVDRAHIHNHIIFNSTTLDCTRKFRDFRLSGLALARLSDIVCLEYRLSVIIRKPYGERQKRTEYPEKKSQRDEICEAIDAALARKPKDFMELIGILHEAGYEYKDGKQPSLRGKGHARFARFRSLGKGYSVEELCEVIAGNAVHKSKFVEKNRTSARSSQVHQKAELSFLIDVRAKMQEGKGAGYARWAKVFNLKQMAKAMMFMEEQESRVMQS